MHNKRASLVFAVVATVTAPACQRNEQDPPAGSDDQAELQALLEDQPLTRLSPGAAASAVPPGVAPSGSVRSGVVLPDDNPLGQWDFDDCTPLQTQLFDASFHNNTAFRSVGVGCTAGLQGSAAVAIAAPEDIVYVPDQPSFRFEAGVTVAGWFQAAATGGTRTLFRKRDKHTSSFALVLHGGKYKFVFALSDGRAIGVTSPHKAVVGAFQHVAATYDGTTARLYVDGVEVDRVAVAGTIPLGPGPLVIGNDGSERRFSGAIDSALFATHALTADELLALTCLTERPTVVVTPPVQTTAPGVSVAFDVAATNHNPPVCTPIQFHLSTSSAGNDLALDPPPFFPVVSEPAPSGATVHFTVTATPSASIDGGATFSVPLFIDEPITNFSEFDSARVIVTEPVTCHVSTERELMITSVTVVDDPRRTVFDPDSQDPRNGVWTFKHLMENLAATPEDAPAMVEAMLTSFTAPQLINGFAVAARAKMQSLVLDGWPRTADGALDLARAPLRLQGIVDRFDLRDLGNGDAGEGRFVFAFNSPTSPASPLQALLIFEYKLPAATDQDVLDWAQAFHALGTLPFGEAYNAALQAITERFVGRGVQPGRPNGSAISAVRSNEVAFGTTRHDSWELRQFALSPASGRLEPQPLALTPDASLDETSTLASYINANQAAILADAHTLPSSFAGQPFQAGAILNTLPVWTAPGVDPEVRHHFSRNTCNGCHNFVETGAPFSQFSPRVAGAEAGLSGFLTGTTIADPVTGQPRSFNDLARRNADLKAIVCADPLAGPRAHTLRKGIQRVH